MRQHWVIFAGGTILVVVAAQWIWRQFVAADVAAAALAKVVCSCVFVDKRSLASCRADSPPGFEEMNVMIDNENKSATGTVLRFVTRRADFSEIYGCTLEP